MAKNTGIANDPYFHLRHQQSQNTGIANGPNFHLRPQQPQSPASPPASSPAAQAPEPPHGATSRAWSHSDWMSRMRDLEQSHDSSQSIRAGTADRDAAASNLKRRYDGFQHRSGAV